MCSKKLLRIGILFSVLLVQLTLVARSAEGDDMLGCVGFTWGDNIETVSNKVKVIRMESYPPENLMVLLSQRKIGGKTFDVAYGFREEGLAQIDFRLNPIKGETLTETEAEELFRVLGAKYGQRAKSSKSQDEVSYKSEMRSGQLTYLVEKGQTGHNSLFMRISKDTDSLPEVPASRDAARGQR